MNIAVAGTGYVGLSIATLLSRHHHVEAVDIVPEKVDMINRRVSPIADTEIEQYFANVSLNLHATLDAREAYTNAEVIDVNGDVIPHLYAAGLNAGGWIGPYYPGSGTAVMGTVHWGRKAGAAAAKN